MVVAHSLLAGSWGECFTIHSLPALVYLKQKNKQKNVCLFFSVFLKWKLIPLFMPESVYSGSVSWDDCGRMFPCKLRVSSFPESAHSDFVTSRNGAKYTLQKGISISQSEMLLNTAAKYCNAKEHFTDHLKARRQPNAQMTHIQVQN